MKDYITSFHLLPHSLFAPLGKAKKHVNCMTEESFWSHFIVKAFNSQHITPPTKMVILSVYNWINYFTGHFNTAVGIQKIRSFKFIRDSQYPGYPVVVYYKVNCLKPTWEGYFNQYGYHHMLSYPDGIPAIVPPTPLSENDLPNLKKFQKYFNPDDKDNWTKFFSDQFHANEFPEISNFFAESDFISNDSE